MASLIGKFDPNAEAQTDPGKLPTGEYLVQVVDSDVKPTKNNTGEYAELTYEVMDGPLKGRKHWARITLDNQNKDAVEIGQRQMASLREATGVANPRDTQDFHNIPHIIRIEFYAAGSAKRNGQVRQYDEAEIKAWKKAEAGNAPAAVAVASPTTTAPSEQAATPPWKRAA
ncbi:MAG: DUF669 domain-containing protein [Cypionkella sp.]